jgi:hypothetical protein
VLSCVIFLSCAVFLYYYYLSALVLVVTSVVVLGVLVLVLVLVLLLLLLLLLVLVLVLVLVPVCLVCEETGQYKDKTRTYSSINPFQDRKTRQRQGEDEFKAIQDGRQREGDKGKDETRQEKTSQSKYINEDKDNINVEAHPRDTRGALSIF